MGGSDPAAAAHHHGCGSVRQRSSRSARISRIWFSACGPTLPTGSALAEARTHHRRPLARGDRALVPGLRLRPCRCDAQLHRSARCRANHRVPPSLHRLDLCRHRIRRRTVRRLVCTRPPPYRLHRRSGRGRGSTRSSGDQQRRDVVLAANTDGFAFERAREVEGLRVAAVTQVVVNLMTGPGRNPTEAEALLAWMEENEDAWRR